MTERIYYIDPYAIDFEATVVGVEPAPDAYAGKTGVVLDKTAFYPTSGGQPFDVGRLGDAAVIDVIDRDEGGILHVIDGAVDRGPIRGRIDWTRRFDHMQQHTGQHVLSAAFDRALQVRTVSFHLGSVTSTIDLHREVTAGEIARAETDANQVVWEDRSVTIRFAGADEAAQLPLRKESARDGTLRIVEVADFDVSACGGTHVARTGAIGIIAVTGTERFRGGTRIEFVCGGRALASFRTLRDTMASATRLLSVVPGELSPAIERLQSESKDARRQIKDLQSRLAEFEAASLADRAEPLGSVRGVVTALEGMDANGLKTIAASITSRQGLVAVLVSTPSPSFVVVARAGDLKIDAAAILKQLIASFGGKGGGRPELAQGGGLQGSAADILAAARGAISGA